MESNRDNKFIIMIEFYFLCVNKKKEIIKVNNNNNK